MADSVFKQFMGSLSDKITRDFALEHVKSLGTIPTGSIVLDWIISGGEEDDSRRGIPRGRLVEIFGKQSSGKTTAALSIAAQEQKIIKKGRPGGIVWEDFEQCFDPHYARKLGLDVDDEDSFTLFRHTKGLEGFSKFLDMAWLHTEKNFKETGQIICPISLIVIDSLAAMRSVQELDLRKSMEDVYKRKGLHAAVIAQMLARHATRFGMYGVTVVVLNQTREKLGEQMAANAGPFGAPKFNVVDDPDKDVDVNVPGGSTVKFYYSTRIYLQKVGFETGKIKHKLTGKELWVKSAQRVRATSIKNKVSRPHRIDEFTIRFGKGIDNFQTILDKCVAVGVVSQAGSWYKYPADVEEPILKEHGEQKFLRRIIDSAKGKTKEERKLYQMIRRDVVNAYNSLDDSNLMGMEDPTGDAIVEEEILDELFGDDKKKSKKKKKEEVITTPDGEVLSEQKLEKIERQLKETEAKSAKVSEFEVEEEPEEETDEGETLWVPDQEDEDDDEENLLQ
jgi:recombination protein RecA